MMNPIQLTKEKVTAGTWYHLDQYLPPPRVHILVSDGVEWTEDIGCENLAGDYNSPVVPCLPNKAMEQKDE